MKTKTLAALGLVSIIALFMIVHLRSRSVAEAAASDRQSESHAFVPSRQNLSNVDLPHQHPPSRDEGQIAAEEYDYNQEIVGLIPYLSDPSLLAIGAKSEQQRRELNELIEVTFHELIDTVVANGETSTSEDGRISISAQVEDQTRARLAHDFYFELERVVGQDSYQEFLRSRSLDFVNTKMLNFGENRIQITLQKQPDGAVSVSLATSLIHSNMFETHSVTKLVSLPSLKDNFPRLVDLLEEGI